MRPPASDAGGLTDRHLALLATLAGILWAIGAIDLESPAPERVALLLMGVALAAWILVGRPVADASLPGLIAGLYAITIGGIERIERPLLEGGSDVVRATQEAISVLLRFSNPYEHYMITTLPPGSPFVYPPGEPFFYLPADLLFGSIERVETWTGILTVAALVVAGARVGAGRAALVAMLYATWGIAAFRTTDGGNDVSGASLVVVGLVALSFAGLSGLRGRIAFVVSAVALGWAVAFKQLAVIVWPLVVRYVAVTGADWRRYLAISGGVVALFVVPFLLWSPGVFIGSMWQALTFHEEVWGLNLANTLEPYVGLEDALPVFFVVQILGTLGLIALAVRARLETIGVAALAAAGILLFPLLLARWATQSYFVYAATIALAGSLLIEDAALGRDRRRGDPSEAM